MKLYKILVKNPEPNNYAGFMVAGVSTLDALDSVYRYVCLNREGRHVCNIPYIFRFSNLETKCIGEFVPGTLLASNILMTNFYNA